jgi:hypothetical protein
MPRKKTAAAALVLAALVAAPRAASAGELNFTPYLVDKGEGSTRLRLTLSGPLVGAHFTF